MSLNSFTKSCNDTATFYLKEIEKSFSKDNADVFAYFGSIDSQYESVFKVALESLAREKSSNNHNTLCIILQTFGGSIETTEKFVTMIRNIYERVYFIIPTYAMSAGTIWCMSGDKIFMDNSSSLGPIDTQIYSQITNSYVPANGYISEYTEIIEKANKNELSDIEFVLFSKKFDYAFLNSCKKLNELTIKLLKKWLVEYKFKDWHVTETNHKTVTRELKESRAEEIACALKDYNKWCIHSRPIMLQDLKDMRLKIDDYSLNNELKMKIDNYMDYMNQYFKIMNIPNTQFVHTRTFI